MPTAPERRSPAPANHGSLALGAANHEWRQNIASRRIGLRPPLDLSRVACRHFPIGDAHPLALHAAEMAEAAGAQGRFWEMHDLIYWRDRALEPALLRSLAERIGLDLERLDAKLAPRQLSRIALRQRRDPRAVDDQRRPRRWRRGGSARRPSRTSAGTPGCRHRL